MSIEAMKEALDWFKCFKEKSMSRNNAEALADEVFETLSQAIEQAEKQEPVRIMGFNCVCGRRMEVSAEQGVVPAPQRRQPLTAQEIEALFPEKCSDDGLSPYWYAFARAIEEAHGIGEQK